MNRRTYCVVFEYKNGALQMFNGLYYDNAIGIIGNYLKNKDIIQMQLGVEQ